MGTLLGCVAVWLIVVLGSLKKGENLWSFQTVVITVFMGVGFFAVVRLSPNTSTDSLAREAAIFHGFADRLERTQTQHPPSKPEDGTSSA